MRGYPEFNFPVFDNCASILRYEGFEVISPADLDREIGFDASRGVVTKEETLAMIKRDLAAIETVDALVYLPGAEHSAGATLEITWAKFLGKPVLAYDNLV